MNRKTFISLLVGSISISIGFLYYYCFKDTKITIAWMVIGILDYCIAYLDSKNIK